MIDKGYVRHEDRVLAEKARRKYPAYYAQKDAEAKAKADNPLKRCCGSDPILLSDVLYRPEYDSNGRTESIGVIRGKSYQVRCTWCMKRTDWYKEAKLAAEEWNERKADMGITEKQIDICEARDWRVRVQDDGEIELENWSPAGENILFYVHEDDETFVGGVKRIAAEFDPEEHAELYIRIRGTNGVPNSIRELLDDADAIDKMLQDLAAALAETEDPDG